MNKKINLPFRHFWRGKLLVWLLTAAILPWAIRAQQFAPQYQLAPFWSNFTGFSIEAADTGVVCGQDNFGISILPYATASFLFTSGTNTGASQSFISLESNPGGGQGNEFRSVSRFGNRYLFGGQSNGLAITYSQTNIFGMQSPSYRNLQPNGYGSGVVEGVTLFTNSGGLLETAVGTVFSGLLPAAGWWENGFFRILPRDPDNPDNFNGYAQAHGVSSFETTLDYTYRPVIVPAFEIVGEYGTNFLAPPHACFWQRYYYYSLTTDYYQHDIHPAGFTSSRANGIGNAYRYGGGNGGDLWIVGDGVPINGTYSHALIWNYVSPHDVHPAGYQSSSARATAFNMSVGVATTNGVTHAMLWAGFTPVDLHGYFPEAISSQATGISPDGSIVGSYVVAGNLTVPFVLRPLGFPGGQYSNIGGTILVTSNDIYNAYYLPNVRFSQACVKDNGMTCFSATEPNYPYTALVLSRKPGGPFVPRLSTGEPLDGSLISSVDAYCLDESNRLHAIVELWGGNYSGREVEVQPNAAVQVMTDTGEVLPDGATIQSLNGVICSDDGRVVMSGYDTNNNEFLLLRQVNTKTLILRTQFGYPSGPNPPNNLNQLGAGGVATNGDVLFTANRYVYDNPASKHPTSISLFYWSKGVMTEIVPLGGMLAPGYYLTRAEGCSMNARGDMAVQGFTTNSTGEYKFALFRKMAGSNAWEKVVADADLAPDGVVSQIDFFCLNNAGTLLISATVNGNYEHLVSRPGGAITNYRAGQDTNGVLDVRYNSFNRYEESVTVPDDYQTGNTPEVDFYCPRSSLVNYHKNGAGISFDFQAPITNRPYAVFSAAEVAGPWSLWVTNFNATTVLTHFADTNPGGAVPRQFFRGEREP